MVKNRCIDKKLDLINNAGLLLFMLLSRPKQNIAEKAFAMIEDSSDLNDMSGLISDANVKILFVRKYVFNKFLGYTCEAFQYLY